MDAKPLFLEWMQEMAADAGRRATRMATLYPRIVRALRNHKEPIYDARTLRLLPGVGEKTVQVLCNRLLLWCKDSGHDFPRGFDLSAKKTKAAVGSNEFLDPEALIAAASDSDSQAPSKKKRKTTKKPYVPRHRTGGYAILLALYLIDPHLNGKNRDVISQAAAKFSDTSFSPAVGSLYLAWNSMKTLMQHEYVYKRGATYILTDEGRSVAKVLKESEGIQSEDCSIAEHDSSFYDTSVCSPPPPTAGVQQPSHVSSSEIARAQLATSAQQQDSVNGVTTRQRRTRGEYMGVPYAVWQPNEVDIIACIDNREVRSQTERDFFTRALEHAGVQSESRVLPVGDMVWVARRRRDRKEAVLNVICERKRIDDLALSIRDGRYQEQKVRLLKTGMTHCFYLVEDIKGYESLDSVRKAIATTLTTGFRLRRFKDIEDTVAFIADITHTLKQILKPLVVIYTTIDLQLHYLSTIEDFRKEFESENSNYEAAHLYASYTDILKKKQVTVKEIFITMLLAINGISYSRAMAIQAIFPTPKLLIEFYRQHAQDPESEKRMLMHKRMLGEIPTRRVGAACLERIYEAWGKW